MALLPLEFEFVLLELLFREEVGVEVVEDVVGGVAYGGTAAGGIA